MENFRNLKLYLLSNSKVLTSQKTFPNLVSKPPKGGVDIDKPTMVLFIDTLRLEARSGNKYLVCRMEFHLVGAPIGPVPLLTLCPNWSSAPIGPVPQLFLCPYWLCAPIGPVPQLFLCPNGCAPNNSAPTVVPQMQCPSFRLPWPSSSALACLRDGKGGVVLIATKRHKSYYVTKSSVFLKRAHFIFISLK